VAQHCGAGEMGLPARRRTSIASYTTGGFIGIVLVWAIVGFGNQAGLRQKGCPIEVA